MSKYRTIREAKKANPDKFKLKKGPNGRNLCRYCGVEVSPPRRTFCSGTPTRYSRKKINGIWTKGVYHRGNGCVHEWMIRSSPKYARDAVFDRDQGICAMCGTVHLRRGRWQADHILAVIAGGGMCGLENLRTLCTTPCHKQVTKELRSRLAAQRKKDKDNADNEASDCNRSLDEEENEK